MRRGVAVAGGLAALDLLDARRVWAKGTPADPRPIPGGFTIPDFQMVPSNADIHVLPPAAGFEMSTITDFAGIVGASETQGSAVGSDDTTYTFDADMRFMQGEYVGLDGRHHNGTFGFI